MNKKDMYAKDKARVKLLYLLGKNKMIRT